MGTAYQTKGDKRETNTDLFAKNNVFAKKDLCLLYPPNFFFNYILNSSKKVKILSPFCHLLYDMIGASKEQNIQNELLPNTY